MEAIIHPGMHKTGTSSIQATLVKLKPKGWTFRDDADGNMSYLVPLLFEDNPENYHSFKARGLSADKISQMRDFQFARLHERLAVAREQEANAIFTAEDVSSASESAVEAIRDLYLSYGFNIRVVAYVRKPVSFMQSIFQQYLKSGSMSLESMGPYWPNYRRRFEKLDKVFGRENVTLKVFDPRMLVSGDVCCDFFSEINIPISDKEAVRVNESLSLGATALLFVQRTFGKGFVQGFDGVHQKNFSFIDALSQIKGEKLLFSRSLVEPIISQQRSDLQWMEERIGQELLDIPEFDNEICVSGNDALVGAASRFVDELNSILALEIRKYENPVDLALVTKLELLRELFYQK